MLPDVPTTAEVGLPDVLVETWFGLVGPANMPKDVVERINRERLEHWIKSGARPSDSVRTLVARMPIPAPAAEQPAP